MKTLAHLALFSLVSLFALAPVTSNAGPGDSCHFHGSKPAAESTILKCANQRKESLVKSGKLDKSWGPLKHDSIAYVDGKKGKEWKVGFVYVLYPTREFHRCESHGSISGSKIDAASTILE
jgi:hypothetical protein